MLLVADFDKYKMMQKHAKRLKPWHIGTHLRVLSDSFALNTNMTGFRMFLKNRCPCAFIEVSHSIRKVKMWFVCFSIKFLQNLEVKHS